MSLPKGYIIIPINDKCKGIPPIPIINTSIFGGSTFENICTPRCGITRFCPKSHDRNFMLVELE